MRPLVGRQEISHAMPLVGKQEISHVRPLVGRQEMIIRHVRPLIGRQEISHVRPLVGRQEISHVRPLVGRLFDAIYLKLSTSIALDTHESFIFVLAETSSFPTVQIILGVILPFNM